MIRFYCLGLCKMDIEMPDFLNKKTIGWPYEQLEGIESMRDD